MRFHPRRRKRARRFKGDHERRQGKVTPRRHVPVTQLKAQPEKARNHRANASRPARCRQRAAKPSIPRSLQSAPRDSRNVHPAPRCAGAPAKTAWVSTRSPGAGDTSPRSEQDITPPWPDLEQTPAAQRLQIGQLQTTVSGFHQHTALAQVTQDSGGCLPGQAGEARQLPLGKRWNGC
jgi:hypothetical protein